MIKYSEDENLGKAAKPIGFFCWTSSHSPIRDKNDLIFAGGGNKFSSLCGLKFEVISSEDEEKPEVDQSADDKAAQQNAKNVEANANAEGQFEICFVAKLRSKIYRRAPQNPSQWYIFRRVDDKTVYVLDKKTTKLMYNFDVDKFFDSDLFKQASGKFLQILTAGVPKLYELYDDPEDGQYIKAIENSLPLIAKPTVQNRTFKLIDFDKK